MTNWRIIKTKESYDFAMQRLLELADTDLIENSDELDEFELLSLLIGHYEESHFHMDKPDPIEAIKFRMDQQNLSQSDMTQYIGSLSKVSEVLNRKRPLSLSMIRRLHDGLGIPADILIQDMTSIEWSLVETMEEEIKVSESKFVVCENAFLTNFIKVKPSAIHPTEIEEFFIHDNKKPPCNCLMKIDYLKKSENMPVVFLVNAQNTKTNHFLMGVTL